MNPHFLIFSVESIVNEPPKKKNETPAQDKLTEQLKVLNESIESLVDLEKKNQTYHGKQSTFEIIYGREKQLRRR